jgi:hypothetical protein
MVSSQPTERALKSEDEMVDAEESLQLPYLSGKYGVPMGFDKMDTDSLAPCLQSLLFRYRLDRYQPSLLQADTCWTNMTYLTGGENFHKKLPTPGSARGDTYDIPRNRGQSPILQTLKHCRQFAGHVLQRG